MYVGMSVFIHVCSSFVIDRVRAFGRYLFRSVLLYLVICVLRSFFSSFVLS